MIDPYHTVYGDSRIQWSDQDGTSTSLGSVQQSLEGLTAEEPSTAASSSEITELYRQDITEPLAGELRVWMGNALEGFCRTRNVDRLAATKIALLYMQSRMQLLTLMAGTLEEQHSTSLAVSATCVENSLKQQGLSASSGPMVKKSLTLEQWRNKLWIQSRTAFIERQTQRRDK